MIFLSGFWKIVSCFFFKRRFPNPQKFCLHIPKQWSDLAGYVSRGVISLAHFSSSTEDSQRKPSLIRVGRPFNINDREAASCNRVGRAAAPKSNYLNPFDIPANRQRGRPLGGGGPRRKASVKLVKVSRGPAIARRLPGPLMNLPDVDPSVLAVEEDGTS